MDNKIQSNKIQSNKIQSNEMDEANTKAYDVYATEGHKAFIKHVMNPTGKKELSYAEMRAIFG